MDFLTKEQRRRIMQAVKSAGSEIELSLAAALQARGCSYRKNNRKVFGNPDFTFCRQKVAVFVDGEFWHGKDWHIRKSDHKSNKKFWLQKIECNMKRDRKVNRALRRAGWQVVRFWGKDVSKNADLCAERVVAAFEKYTAELLGLNRP